MNLIFASQGDWYATQQLVDDMKNQKLPITYKDKDGVEHTATMRTALCPVNLWIYKFPEPFLPVVLNTLGITPGGKVEGKYASMANKAIWLNKLLGFKGIPKDFPTETDKMLWRRMSMDIFPIGIKKDDYGPIPNAVNEYGMELWGERI